MPVRFKIAGKESRVARPTVEVKCELQYYKGNVRVVAVGPDGKRLKHGNLLKIFPNGNVYFYHTITPALGMDLDEDGRLIAVYENPDSTQ